MFHHKHAGSHGLYGCTGLAGSNLAQFPSLGPNGLANLQHILIGRDADPQHVVGSVLIRGATFLPEPHCGLYGVAVAARDYVEGLILLLPGKRLSGLSSPE